MNVQQTRLRTNELQSDAYSRIMMEHGRYYVTASMNDRGLLDSIRCDRMVNLVRRANELCSNSRRGDIQKFSGKHSDIPPNRVT